jgi:D-alanyl-D-alanine carboxypeptidase
MVHSPIVGELHLNLCRSSLRLLNVTSNYLTAKKKYSIAGAFLFALIVIVAKPDLACATVHASIVVDMQTGAILQARNADTPAHPASLTKLMTLFITFEQLERGRMKLNEMLHVSLHAASQQPTKLWLQPGSEISVRSAILGITTRSANDAAVVLAEAIGGSESQFAEQMTRTAQQLGMTRTQFYNASGLPNNQQWTTARDMSKLAIALIKDFPAYYGFFSVRSFRFHGRTIYGHDHLLNEYAGTDGLKTGYINSSGYNLVTSVVRNRRRLVGVVLGGRTARARDLLMMALLTRGFSTTPGTVLAVNRSTRPGTASNGEAAPHLVKADVETPAVSPADSRDCVIQIGGDFSTQSAVRQILRSVIRSASGLLSPRHELVVKLRARRYGARFRQLDEDQAMEACSILHRKGFTCRIVRAPAGQRDLAGAPAQQTAQAD